MQFSHMHFTMAKHNINKSNFTYITFIISPLEYINYGWQRYHQRRRERTHVLKKYEMRRCTVPSPLLTWPSNMKSDGKDGFGMADSVDGCNVLPELKLVATRLRVDTTRIHRQGLTPEGSCRRKARFWHHIAITGSTPDMLFWLSPDVFSSMGYFWKTAGVWNQSFHSPRWGAKLHWASTTCLPVIPLATQSRQFSSRTTKSLDPIVVIVLWVGITW